jgi:hypothetical protein
MTMIDGIRDEWTELLSKGRTGQKLVGLGPLHLYYGVDALGRAVFFLASLTKSAAPKLGDAVRVEHGQREDSKWTVVLTLLDETLLDTFTGLCVELARRTSTAQTEAEALKIFDGTIQEWRVILTIESRKRLSLPAMRGLVAELHYLLVSAQSRGIAAAVEAWTGPYLAPHDFRFAERQVREVKAIRTGAVSIHVSSIDQLDIAPEESLELILVTLNEVPTSSTSSFTLIDLVDQVLNSSLVQSTINEQFHNKLMLASVDISDAFYAETHFELGSVKSFCVTEEFPRLRRAFIPLGVIRTHYELELEAFADYQIERDRG